MKQKYDYVMRRRTSIVLVVALWAGACARNPVPRGLVGRPTHDLPIYRLGNGPDVVDAVGRTNRIGSWWTFEPPHGTVQRYRHDYAVCRAWNRLAWVVSCTLKR